MHWKAPAATLRVASALIALSVHSLAAGALARVVRAVADSVAARASLLPLPLPDGVGHQVKVALLLTLAAPQ